MKTPADHDAPTTPLRFSTGAAPVTRAQPVGGGHSGLCADDTPSRDGPTWTSAGQAWRAWEGIGGPHAPASARTARVALVNAVISAVRKHERGMASDGSLEAALKAAVREFTSRLRDRAA